MNVLSVDAGARATLDYLRSLGEAPQEIHGRVFDNPAPDRLVAEYQVGLASGSSPARRYVAKCFSDDTGARTFQVMRALERALGAQPQALLKLPRACWYDAQRRCLVQERVEAAPFQALDGDALTAALAAAGGALSELHALDVDCGDARTFADHVTELIRPHPLELENALPGVGTRVRVLLDECARRAAPGAGLALPLHRDFHLRQLFRDERNVWVIDWDLYARGDGALDVGNFAMYLSLKLGDVFRAGVESFLSGYAQAGDARAIARAPAYQALGYLRRACKAVRTRGEGGAAQALQLIGRAERTLEHGTFGGTAA